MKTGSAMGRPFVDEVVDEMGKDDAGEYGADMDDGEGKDPEAANEDRIMAVKTLGKALGIQIADPSAAASALQAFVETCGG